MRFLHVNPADRTIMDIEGDDVRDVYGAIIKRNVDFGVVQRGLSIVVYEYGLMEGNGPYFSLNEQLFSGDAILFAFDEAGETIDIPEGLLLMLSPHWFPDKAEVELGIAAGIVRRPETSVNGEVMWSWS